MTEDSFKVGDVVKLNSGGPTMTVREVGARTDGDFGVKVSWFNGTKFDDDYFMASMLKFATPAN